jgi:oxygen-independent coproporphyrinogen-3 oxidase
MHLYVHIPFCDGKCAYCGFYSVPYNAAAGDGFLTALERELDGFPGLADNKLETVYFGGGTPSVLSVPQIGRLAGLVKNRFSISEKTEWTAEGSPNTVSTEKVDALIGAGVNRISLGIQTFSEDVLRAMGRRHTPAQARSALHGITGRRGLRSGCDLIAGLPGVSRGQWRDDVKTVCDLGLKHVSVYALSLEDGTRLCDENRSGKLEIPDEDEVADRLAECAEELKAGGIERYEVSNYAAAGEECRHNLCYWRGCDYIGAGPGAASRLGLVRRVNAPDVEAYIQAADVPREEEEITPQADLQERLIYHFRLSEGIDFGAFCAENGVNSAIRADWENRLQYLAGEGLLTKKDSRFIPTRKGMDFADAVAETFLE